MNDCERYIELISSMIDGAATPDEEREAVSHMESCPECRKFYKTMLELRETLAEPAEAPAGLVEGAMAKIKGGEKRKADARRRTRRRTIRILSAAACFAVVVLAASRLPTMFNKGSSDSAAPAEYAENNAAPAATEDGAYNRKEADSAYDAEIQNEAAPADAAPADASPYPAEMADASPADNSSAPIDSGSAAQEDAGYAVAVTTALDHLRTEYPDDYAYVFMYGALPEGFRGENETELSEGVYVYDVTHEYADELAEKGYTTYYGSGDEKAVAVLIVR